MEKIFYSITTGQILFLLVAVFFVFMAKYNSESDVKEEAEGFEWKQFLGNFFLKNVPNVIQSIFAAFLFLGFVNEFGLEYVAKKIFQLDLGKLETSADMTAAIVSGLVGNAVLTFLVLKSKTIFQKK